MGYVLNQHTGQVDLFSGRIDLATGQVDPARRMGWTDPLAAIPFVIRLQTHRGDNVPMGLYQDVSGTVPAVTDGDLVAAWRDELGGGGLLATQATSGKRPALRFEGGVPVLRFDGVNDCLTLTATAPRQILMGLLIEETAGGDDTIIGNADTNYLIRSELGAYTTPNANDFNNGTGGELRVNGAVTRTHSNLAHVASVKRGAGASTSPDVFNLIGALAEIGGRFFMGYTTSMLISGTALSDMDRVTVESYLETLNP